MKTIKSQLSSNSGMGRLGGAASRGSTPVRGSKGSAFASMEQGLLKNGIKNPGQAKRATGGGPGRQFGTKAAGGDVKGNTPSSNKSFSSNPTILASLASKQYGGKLGM